MTEKHRARLASFVLLEQDGKILLARRANTGYQDGMYQMPSGHVEAGEYPSEAAIRETKEEVGITIDPKNLTFLHASYRINEETSGGDYVDFFFKADTWTGEVANAEPGKCDELIWVSMNELPENTVEVVKEVVKRILAREPFSEIGRSEDDVVS